MLDSQPQINICIVGTGAVAGVHAAAIASVPRANLYGAFDIDEISSSTFCAEHSVPVRFDSFDSLLADSGVDAVTICLPHQLHREYALRVAEAGKHLIIEKPLAPNSRDAAEIADRFRRHALKLTVIAQSRFALPVLRAKERIAEGAMGRLLICKALVEWHRTEAYFAEKPWRATTNGGLLNVHAYHAVDVLRYIGGDVSEVSAFGGTLTHDIEAEDTVAAIIRFSSGAIGVICATNGTFPELPTRIQFHGTKGTILITDRSSNFDYWEYSAEGGLAPKRYCFELDDPLTRASHPQVANAQGHTAQYEDFVDSIITGREPTISGADAVKTVELLETIRLSLR